FAPDVAGRWRYRVTAKDRSGTVSLPEARLQVAASANPGFVRRSTLNPAVFAFENEKPFFAVGENMGWGGKRGSYDYDDWLTPLSKAGGNWIRIWMSSWNCGLEWSAQAKKDWRSGTYHGVGVYSLDNAWKLDTILDTAERNGVYVMLCFGTYGEFKTGGFFGEGQWEANPYNVANGGPCAKPEDFWTNEQARKLYQQRLRYIMARYGYRTGIQGWEFWNEAEAPTPWVGEMARFLKGTGEFAARGAADPYHHAADPYHHLVTTTYGNDAIWKLPEIDFTQTHNYGTGNITDHAPVIYNDARQHAVYNKPHLIGEFGIDWRKSDSEYDPQGLGVNLHNGLWAGLMAGDAGGGMLWWWDNYVHPKNVYAPFVAARRFADTVPWTAGPLQPLKMDAAHQTSGPETWTDLTLVPAGGWGKAATDNFTITPTGLASNVIIPQFLYSTGKADLRTTSTFHVNFTQPGKFIVHVGDVSDTAHLRILLDGKAARDVELSAMPPKDPSVKPDYEKTELRPEYNSYLAHFNKDYDIDVPVGEHTITLDTVAGDWVSMDRITLTGYRSSRFPDVNLYGLTNGNMAILWAQNALHNWKNVTDKKEIPPLHNLATTLHGLKPGRYAVEWWDTEQGRPTTKETLTSIDGLLVLRLPDLASDVAARIEPLAVTRGR
ncbi:MAG: hypothetical protein JOZ57_02405, partial [Abitibacteriaceae bacterium]|nr:hypothetical protein [Abditibacteriaceae bacterium]